MLENLAHQVLAYDAAGDATRPTCWTGWERARARWTPTARTGYDARTGWLVTVVGARGHDWGRLVLVG